MVGYTEGVLFNMNTNEKVCDTLEDQVRDVDGSGEFDNGEKKIYGESAIPYGTYDIEVTYSPKFKRKMVLVKDVPHFSGIRMHWARTAKNLEGCIGVGTRVKPGVLNNSYMTDKLVDLLLQHGNKGTIEIV